MKRDCPSPRPRPLRWALCSQVSPSSGTVTQVRPCSKHCAGSGSPTHSKHCMREEGGEAQPEPSTQAQNSSGKLATNHRRRTTGCYSNSSYLFLSPSLHDPFRNSFLPQHYTAAFPKFSFKVPLHWLQWFPLNSHVGTSRQK